MGIKRLAKWLILSCSLGASSFAFADVGVSVGAGTLGGGLSANWRFNDYVSVGGGINRFSRSGNSTLKGLNYDYNLKLSTDIAFINVYPFGGGFHLTGGLMHNGNSVGLTGQPQGGNYTFNGNTYSAQQVGVVTASLGFKSSATYLGIGWGGNGTWGMTFDLGAMQQGSPRFNLSASAAASNSQLAADVAQQRAKTQSDVNSFTWYPQIALGLYFHF